MIYQQQRVYRDIDKQNLVLNLLMIASATFIYELD